MTESPPIDPNKDNPSPKPHKDKPWHHGDFWLGFLGTLVISWIFGSLTSSLHLTGNWPEIIILLPWILNIVAIIGALLLKRPRIAGGILAFYAAGFILVLVIGIFLTVLCLIWEIKNP